MALWHNNNLCGQSTVRSNYYDRNLVHHIVFCHYYVKTSAVSSNMSLYVCMFNLIEV